MAEPTRILVLANRTANAAELFRTLRERAASGPVRITLLVPATWEVQDSHGGRESACRRMHAATETLRAEGVEIEGVLGDADPVAALESAWSPDRYDEVIVSTLPARISRWLHLDLPHRAERITGAPVTHVVAGEGDREAA